jgi:hypothetical protein
MPRQASIVFTRWCLGELPRSRYDPPRLKKRESEMCPQGDLELIQLSPLLGSCLSFYRETRSPPYRNLGERLPQACGRRRTVVPNYTHIDQVYALQALRSTGVVLDDVLRRPWSVFAERRQQTSLFVQAMSELLLSSRVRHGLHHPHQLCPYVVRHAKGSCVASPGACCALLAKGYLPRGSCPRGSAKS